MCELSSYNHIMLIWHLINLIRPLIWPLSFILKLNANFKRRWDFESQNLSELGCKSFYKDNDRAKVCFHFSSEGEFEQIKYLIRLLLDKGEKVELIFTSPSVEKKVLSLYEKYEDQLRYLRLPLLTFFPFLFGQNVNHWVSARTLIMVRYDFFPELITLGKRLRKFILFSASLKSSKSGWINLAMKRSLFRKYTDLIPATDKDYKQLQLLVPNVRIHRALELRCLEITDRLEKFKSNEIYPVFSEKMARIDAKRKIILAQVWPVEMSIFNNELIEDVKVGETFVYVAPHLLSDSARKELIDRISAYNITIYEIRKDDGPARIIEVFEKISKRPGIIFSSLPGLLCEIYQFFDFAFVGGGHGKGIHSVLEPFIAKAKIFCGPNVNRSTEFDLIQSQGVSVDCIDKLDSVYNNIKNSKDQAEYDIEEFCQKNRDGLEVLYKDLIQ